MINNKISLIVDNEIEEYLIIEELNLVDIIYVYKALSASVEYVIISTPTDNTPEQKYFNTRSVEVVTGNALSIN